jgi:hypothetical protein
VARLATPKPGRVPDPRPLTEGPGPTRSPGSLPAPRVACHCSPAGFDRQQLYRVDQVLPRNAYMLEELDGVKFPVAVKGQHLKKYFPSMWDDGQ